MISMDMTGEDVAKTGGVVPRRAVARSGRRLGSAVGSALRVGPRQRQGRAAERRSDQRRAPRGLRARRAQDRLGREDEPVRRRQRPHRLRQRRRAVAPRLALHRSLLPHELRHARQDERRRDAQRRRLRRARRRGCSASADSALALSVAELVADAGKARVGARRARRREARRRRQRSRRGEDAGIANRHGVAEVVRRSCPQRLAARRRTTACGFRVESRGAR